MHGIQIGNTVRWDDARGNVYYPTVQLIKTESRRLYVRWHRSYASWVSADTANLSVKRGGLDRFDAATGLREIRFEIGATLNCIVDIQSRISSFIPASPETQEWGGFLGGETVSYTDEKQAELATEMLIDLVAQYRK